MSGVRAGRPGRPGLLRVTAMPLEWGGVWSIATVQVTGIPIFDFFFTLVLVFGLVGWLCGLLWKLAVRS